MSNRTTHKRPNGTPISDYLDSRDFHLNRTWTISEGMLFTNVNGEWMNEGEFRERYPIKTMVNFNFRPSPDTTKIL